ncbi:hypothetical protein DB30_04655 [Enhygromyxa salina]|uniref:DUF2079 domain-containing protein n=1 Tax=Enhygromyxa salina TaxID=215803 RepID=A0A0C2DCP5_9BACT|nr:DUF2079 domain-containing protein [Enhygromyxa salina]KIG19190.1 hypothetical protein DB30_04655 [Enhygromyxa salina]
MKARALAVLDALAKAGSWSWDQRARVGGVLACGAAPGYAWWMLRNRDTLTALADNRVKAEVTNSIVATVVVSIALALVGIAAVHLRAKRQAPADTTDATPGLGETIDRCLRHGVLALMLPAIAALTTPKLETSNPWFTLALAGFATGVLVVWCYRLPTRERPPAKLWQVHAPALLSTLAVGFYIFQISRLALLHHYNLTTSTHDLGIYDNLFWNASHGNGLRSTLVKGDTHLAAHFDPILILLSPFYRISPGAHTIIVLQTVWIAAGAVPLYLLVVRKLSSHWAGFALVVSYLAHPGIQGANLYDFHSLSLAIPLLMTAVLLLETGASKSYAVTLLLLLLVREDMSLLSAALGVYALVTGRGRVGVLTILASIAYLGVVKLAMMPDAGLLMESTDHSYGYSTYFGYLIPKGRSGVSELLASLISNPVFVLRSVMTEDKLLYLARCFGPLLVLPFFARPGRVLLVYGLGFCLLGTKPALFSLHFQYVTLHTPFAFVLVPLVLADPAQSPALARFAATQVQFARAGALGCAMMSVLVSWKYGGLVENDSFQAGYYTLVRTYDEEAAARYEWLRQAADAIPPDASVAATDHLVPHLSGRAMIEKYPDADARGLDYLLVDRARRRRSGPSLIDVKPLETSGAYIVIDEHPTGLVLLKRDPSVPLPVEKPKKSKKTKKTKKSKQG